MRILIVEDDPDVADLLRRALAETGWAADVAARGEEGLRLLRRCDYDLVVLDLNLPDGDGLEVCRAYRAAGGRAPVLVLTARTSLRERVTGLDAGADDYLAKPFAVEELLARLRALSRRPQPVLDVSLRVGDLELDTATRTARRRGVSIKLTAREYALLEYLMRRAGRVVSRTQILEHVWNDEFDPVGNVVDVTIGRVRRRIDLPGLAPLIHSRRGMGYVLSEEETDDGG